MYVCQVGQNCVTRLGCALRSLNKVPNSKPRYQQLEFLRHRLLRERWFWRDERCLADAYM